MLRVVDGRWHRGSGSASHPADRGGLKIYIRGVPDELVTLALYCNSQEVSSAAIALGAPPPDPTPGRTHGGAAASLNLAAVSASPDRQRLDRQRHRGGVADPRQHGGLVDRERRLGAGRLLVRRPAVAAVPAGPGRQRLDLRGHRGGVADPRQHGGLVGRDPTARCRTPTGTPASRGGSSRWPRPAAPRPLPEHRGGVADPRQHGGLVGRTQRLGAGRLLV